MDQKDTTVKVFVQNKGTYFEAKEYLFMHVHVNNKTTPTQLFFVVLNFFLGYFSKA